VVLLIPVCGGCGHQQWNASPEAWGLSTSSCSAGSAAAPCRMLRQQVQHECLGARHRQLSAGHRRAAAWPWSAAPICCTSKCLNASSSHDCVGRDKSRQRQASTGGVAGLDPGLRVSAAGSIAQLLPAVAPRPQQQQQAATPYKGVGQVIRHTAACARSDWRLSWVAPVALV
jgi:hypothetical protein